MAALSPEQLEQLHAELLQLKSKLEQQLYDGESATGVVTLDQSSVGRVSRIDALQQQSMAVSTQTKAKASLREVLAALKRIESKDYGYCGECDEPIEYKRLCVQPQANFCLKCQDQLDQA